jgi:lysophospholipid acyltransferase (LPLAT)-like uncharacterized protein
MYFAVLQGGAEPLGRSRAERWTRRVMLDTAALPFSLGLRGYRAAMGRFAALRVEGSEPEAPAVLCAWHHDLLLLLPERGPRRDWLALPREARVDPIARTAEALGFRVLREGFGDDGAPPPALVDLVREGNRALLSADGPKHPGQVRSDAVKLALAAKAPLVPVTVRGGRGVDLPGGIRFVLPPGEVVLRYGEPIRATERGEDPALAELARALR